MKPTTRGTLAAALTCVATATAGAATASSAAAVTSVPVPVPLGGVEKALKVELPKARGELPVPVPGEPKGTRYVEGRLLPDRAIPQLPVSGGLPGGDVRAPLPHVLGSRFDHLAVSAPPSDLRALAPGLSVQAPVGQPEGDRYGLPGTGLPQAGVVTPMLQTVPAATVVTGPGL
ncbi:hypothetical protein [Streptomyces broussonetiae]|uniref:Secreted protein n=1 Tax=Streptomyces broussonetiae TaxID=2686304 RepID=A0ABV5E7M8_9ACTN